MAQRFPLFSADVSAAGDGRVFSVTGPGAGSEDPIAFRTTLQTAGQQDYLDLHARLAATFGTRLPSNRQAQSLPEPAPWHQPLLTEPVDPRILYGYGDPCVLRAEEEDAWYLLVTSNDAPDAFPILRSADLQDWALAGFAFPEGHKPPWAAEGFGVADYWAPELHRIGGEYVLCFCARQHEGTMAIGLARAASPAGPFTLAPEPLLGGGVIDAHLFAPDGQPPMLVWKEDSNGVWPRLLAGMIAREPELAGDLFADEESRRTAALAAALWQWGQQCPPMEQFFLLQPLIEVVTDAFDETRSRLRALGSAEARTVLGAMETPIRAQTLAADHLSLTGEPTVLIANDLPWEGHLIEGPWLTEQDGRHYLFYAANDFTNLNYGIGVAIANHALGPYRKLQEPLIRSDAAWIGPGHPSIAPGPGGRPHLFYHAYPPGTGGYKAFRALLTCGLRFSAQAVTPLRARVDHL